ncbi:MAG: DinB family protein [Saprospiraceae bacterium]
MSTDQIQKYRNNGAVGALLDEYERAMADLKNLVASIEPQELVAIVDDQTKDPDCRSIQSVLTHVVRSGFGYATYIRNKHGEALDFRARKTRKSTVEYVTDLEAVFDFTEQSFALHPEIVLEAYEPEQKMRVRWGQLYDVEQLMEHAIVHILRHRRQIERFLLKLRH